MAPSLSSPNALCETCKSLNLTPRSFIVCKDDKEWGNSNEPDSLSIKFGSVTDTVKRSQTCPLCRLVLRSLSVETVPETEDDKPIDIELSWNTDGPSDPRTPWDHVPTVRVLRPYAVKAGGGFVQRAKLNLFPEITLWAEDWSDPASHAAQYLVRPVPAKGIDFSLVRGWVEACNTRHATACTHNAEPTAYQGDPCREIPDFRCIDVEQNCLARVQAGTKFAALSYVWGRRVAPFETMTSNVAARERPGALAQDELWSKIPATIQDAIQVTREMNMRYIWIDSLCIIQDDTTGIKLAHIKQMDMVYMAADIVIIAAGSVDASAGLAGVRPGTRGAKQPVEEISPGFRLAFKTRWQDWISQAPYYRRGWTFQEDHFAARSLVFIGGQVLFRCRAVSEWQEHLFEAATSEDVGRGKDPDGADNDIGEFEGLIQTYSDRVLSFDSDIYNAFAGVASQISKRLDTDFCHGIPVRFFDWFLLWHPIEDQARRPGAPSWSWAGWTGGSWPHMWDWYTRNIRKVQKAMKTRTWVAWYQRGEDAAHACQLVRSNKDRKTARFPALDCSTILPTDRVLEATPQYTHDILSKTPGSGFLQFWTVAISLKVDTATSAAPIGSVKGVRLGLYGRSGKELGTVIVHTHWVAQQSGGIPVEKELILICEGRDERAANDRNVDDEDGWRFMAMLVDWKDGWAERAGIGSIGKDQLGEALGDGPVWKEIILG